MLWRRTAFATHPGDVALAIVCDVPAGTEQATQGVTDANHPLRHLWCWARLDGGGRGDAGVGVLLAVLGLDPGVAL